MRPRPGSMSMEHSASGRGPVPRPRVMQLASTGQTPGRAMGTNGCKHLMIAVTPSCGTSEAHRRAMTNSASYLPDAAEGERDPSHLVPELSRRARGFATWAVIRALGRQGIARAHRTQLWIAREMARQLAQEPGIMVENEVILKSGGNSLRRGPLRHRRRRIDEPRDRAGASRRDLLRRRRPLEGAPDHAIVDQLLGDDRE